MLPKVLLLATVAAFLLVGCSKGPAEPASNPAVAAPQTAPAPAGSADLQAKLDELTQALRKFSAEQRRVPQSLNELVTSGYVKELPKAPAGQTISIDSKQLKVIVR